MSRIQLTARLDGDDLRVSLVGSETYMDDDPNHRTRDVSVSLELTDPAAMRAARARLVPLTKSVAETPDESPQRIALGIRRLAAIPSADAGPLAELQTVMAAVVAAYGPVLTQMARRAARQAEEVAYLRDTPDEGGTSLEADS